MANNKMSGLRLIILVIAGMVIITLVVSKEIPLEENEEKAGYVEGNIAKCEIIRAPHRYGDTTFHFKITIEGSDIPYFSVNIEKDVKRAKRYYKRLCDAGANVSIEYETRRFLRSPGSRKYSVREIIETKI
jgi:uncharacterized glyoxalase superfamily protein PhnB